MLTVSRLQQLLSDLPPDLEVVVAGAPAEAVFRFAGLKQPDVISIEDDATYPDRGRDAVLWIKED